MNNPKEQIMRQIVYDNIIELIKENHSATEQTKTGKKYVLYGKDGNPILSTYSNYRKIELFINDALFASAKTPTTLFQKHSAHLHQLYNIESVLSGQGPNFDTNDTRTHKYKMGATSRQTNALQIAWFNSRKINQQLYNNIGNNR